MYNSLNLLGRNRAFAENYLQKNNIEYKVIEYNYDNVKFFSDSEKVIQQKYDDEKKVILVVSKFKCQID